MVCPRCIKVVREELEKLGLHVGRVELGEAAVEDTVSQETIEEIGDVLEANGFELLTDQKQKTIEKIKIALIEAIYGEEQTDTHRKTLSAYLSGKTGKDYKYLSSLFSSVENITIEKYFILQKIERVKELLKYEELTLSEIAYRLNYSSTQHLSSQFKQITGMSPTQFKKSIGNQRKPLDKLT